MKLIKTRKQSVLFRFFEEPGRYYFTVGAFQFFGFGSRELQGEVAMWKFLAEALGKDAMFDMGMPKPRGEVLVVGKCYSPPGGQVQAAEVSLNMGEVQKKLYVFGNRQWIKRAGVLTDASDPALFAEVDVSYENAFGGPDYDRNPIGMGTQKIVTEHGNEIHPLPKIEDPAHLVCSPKDRPEPAGFGPIDIAWPQRMKKAGTCDQKWLRERFPGFAEDMDPTIFNMAPPDQWIEGYWKGDESFGIANMHAEQTSVSGKLPAFRARTFIEQRVGDGVEIREIAMRPETVWLFPNAQKGVLIHRGTTEIGTDDGEDINFLLLAHEALEDEPLPAEHYHNELARRTDPEKGALLMLNDHGLAPEFEVEDQTKQDGVGLVRAVGAMAENAGRKAEKEKARVEEEKKKAEKMKEDAEKKKDEALAKGEKQKARAAEVMQKQGQTSDALAAPLPVPPPPPEAPGLELPPAPDLDPHNIDPDKVTDYYEKLKVIADQKKQEMAAESENQKQAALDRLAQICEDHDLDFEEMKKKFDPPPMAKKRPVFIADEALDQMRETRDKVGQRLLALRASLGVQLETLKAKMSEHAQNAEFPDGQDQFANAIEQFNQINPDDPEIIAKLKKAEQSSWESYKLNAHNLPRLEPPEPEKAAEHKERFLNGLAKRSGLAGGDFYGISLAGLDLTGLDLKGALFELVDFTGADLSNADLSGAVFAWADLSGAKLNGAILEKTCLGCANLTGAELHDARLTETILAKADLTRTDFTGAVFERAILLDAVLKDTNFSGASLKKAAFMEQDFSGANFSGADLSETVFLKPRMAGLNFAGATAKSTSFIEPDLEGAVFTRADLTNARFLQAAKLAGADFREAILDEANLMEADLTNASLVGARINKANLMKARACGADLTGAVGLRANMIKANLESARLVGVNLMEANLLKTRLVDADCKRASLYSAEFMKAVLGNTNLEGANLNKTKIVNWRPDDKG